MSRISKTSDSIDEVKYNTIEINDIDEIDIKICLLKT